MSGLLTGVEPAREGITLGRGEYAQRMENVIMRSRASFLVQVVGEDPTYVAGYFVDTRGLRVGTELVRFAKDQIILRIEIDATPHPDSLQFHGVHG